MYLFGGRDEAGNFFNDVWRANLKPDQLEWELLQDDSPLPARAFHTAVLYQDSVYIFGGETENGFANDVWRYDTLRNWWVRCVIVDDNSSKPAARGGHAAFYWIDEAFYIWGGYNNEDGYLQDMWRFDFQSEEWTLVDQGAVVPSPRSHPAYDIRNDKLVLTGGQINQGDNHSFFWNPWLNFVPLYRNPDYAGKFAQHRIFLSPAFTSALRSRLLELRF